LKCLSDEAVWGGLSLGEWLEREFPLDKEGTAYVTGGFSKFVVSSLSGRLPDDFNVDPSTNMNN
jgi:hypothetical protein